MIKGLKPKNKGHANFYKCCDLKKKVYLIVAHFENEDKIEHCLVILSVVCDAKQAMGLPAIILDFYG